MLLVLFYFILSTLYFQLFFFMEAEFMRLHDIQVTLSAADIANRYQAQHQQVAAQAQAQEAINENARAEIKKTQTGQAQQEQNAKEITEDEKRLKQWNKGSHEQGQEDAKDRSGGEDKPQAGAGKDHIIDIKA
jgi:hypothetical protein